MAVSIARASTGLDLPVLLGCSVAFYIGIAALFGMLARICLNARYDMLIRAAFEFDAAKQLFAVQLLLLAAIGIPAGAVFVLRDWHAYGVDALGGLAVLLAAATFLTLRCLIRTRRELDAEMRRRPRRL